ncbi:putative AC transposase [Bienertia sinuspersici]
MDALAWCGCNRHRYPMVSHVAHVIFAIPLSTTASESTFSVGSRHIDPFRSCLTLKIVQALICTKDWLRAKNGASGVEVEENIKDLEEIEKDVECLDLDDEIVFMDTLF